MAGKINTTRHASTSFARLARTPFVATILLILATFFYATVPSLNFYAHGWEYPLLLTGLMRLGFSVGVVVLIAVIYPPLLSWQSMKVIGRVVREERKLLGLAMLTTADVALFSLSYRFVDISVSTAMTAMVPAANVVILALLNGSWLTLRQTAWLAASVLGVLVVMWAGSSALELRGGGGGELWRVGVGVMLGLGMVACSGLTVSTLRLGEILAVEWYWNELGKDAVLVWCGSMLTLALAQGITAPLFLLSAASAGLPSLMTMALMFMMGLVVLLGTALWALANGSGLRPMLNSLGDLQPAWAVLILAVLGIAGGVDWTLLAVGLALIVGANIGLQIWGGRDW